MNLFKVLSDFLKRVAFCQRTVTVTEPAWFPWMAAMTGVLAAVAGFLVVNAGNLANQAMIDSSLSTRAQTKASDFWNEYEANSIKATVVETELLHCQNAEMKILNTLDKKFRTREPGLMDQAKEQETEAEKFGESVEHRMKERARLTYAMVAIQSAIGICSIAVLSKKHTAFVLGAVISLIGIAITVFAVVAK